MVNEMRRVDVGLDEANELLNQAGLQSVDSMEILQGGWDNTNILLTLTDASKVVLKVWNANTIEEVRSCLLYTSPSPRDVEESRMPSSA